MIRLLLIASLVTDIAGASMTPSMPPRHSSRFQALFHQTALNTELAISESRVMVSLGRASGQDGFRMAIADRRMPRRTLLMMILGASVSSVAAAKPKKATSSPKEGSRKRAPERVEEAEPQETEVHRALRRISSRLELLGLNPTDIEMIQDAIQHLLKTPNAILIKPQAIPMFEYDSESRTLSVHVPTLQRTAIPDLESILVRELYRASLTYSERNQRWRKLAREVINHRAEASGDRLKEMLNLYAVNETDAIEMELRDRQRFAKGQGFDDYQSYAIRHPRPQQDPATFLLVHLSRDDQGAEQIDRAKLRITLIDRWIARDVNVRGLLRNAAEADGVPPNDPQRWKEWLSAWLPEIVGPSRPTEIAVSSPLGILWLLTRLRLREVPVEPISMAALLSEKTTTQLIQLWRESSEDGRPDVERALAGRLEQMVANEVIHGIGHADPRRPFSEALSAAIADRPDLAARVDRVFIRVIRELAYLESVPHVTTSSSRVSTVMEGLIFDLIDKKLLPPEWVREMVSAARVFGALRAKPPRRPSRRFRTAA